MTCTHLRAVEQAIIDRGIREELRGTVWTKNCREWVYFECYIDLAAVRTKFALDPCVKDHVHRGTHSGSERGLYCEQCYDGVMGRYEAGEGIPVFRAESFCASCATLLPPGLDLNRKCLKCGFELHSCKMCAYFDTSLRFECSQPIKERIPRKDAHNNCTLYMVRSTIPRETSTSKPLDARAAFENLFRK